MEILKNEILNFIDKLEKSEKDDLLYRVQNLVSVYPFNEFEYQIVNLFDKQSIVYNEYLELRNNYIDRNKNLYLYEMAPRNFGEKWGEKHIIELLGNECKKVSGEYDLELDDIKIEVKASRGVEKISGKNLLQKAISSTEIRDKQWEMNFQQLKPSLCDVFIWIGVFKDTIFYWVLSSDDVRNNPYFSNQHRKEKKSDSIFEGQIMIKDSNFEEFEKYRTNVGKLYHTIKDKK